MIPKTLMTPRFCLVELPVRRVFTLLFCVMFPELYIINSLLTDFLFALVCFFESSPSIRHSCYVKTV